MELKTDEEAALTIETEAIIQNEDIKPFKKLITSVFLPSKKQKKKQSQNGDNKKLMDFFADYYPNFLVIKLVIVLASWHDNGDTPPKEKLMHLDLLNTLLTKLDEQPSTTLIPDHLVAIKPILVTILVKEAFTADFKHLSAAITLIASQIFQIKNRHREWTELLEYVCATLEYMPKVKMGLMLLRDFPLNVSKTWFMGYIDKLQPVILGHLGESEEKEAWVLAYGALVNMTLQLCSTSRHSLTEELYSILVQTLQMFLNNGKDHFVKKVFEDLLGFLERENWRYRLDHFWLLSKFVNEVTEMNKLTGETKVAVVSVLVEVENRGVALIEKSKTELHGIADSISALTIRQNESALATRSGSTVPYPGSDCE